MSDSSQPLPVIELCGADIVAMRETTLRVVEKVDWVVRRGEFWVVAGQSHSGKSDLLLHAAGLMVPVAGSGSVLGYDLREFGRSENSGRLRLGLVFADGKLFNHLTVAENVTLPLRYHTNQTDEECAQAVARLLDGMELTPFANLTPANVPANWRQRAALARALILRPELLLLDQPLQGLNVRHRDWLRNFLNQLWRGHELMGGQPMTVVATTDDLREWRHPQRRFAVLSEGRFTQLGIWDAEKFAQHPAAKDLLSAPAENAY
jgi:ABC-type sulfate/molybdate transport systems ATPase subunit